MKNHHFPLSQNLAQTNGLLVLFQEHRSIFKSTPQFPQKGRNSSLFSISGPKSALLGPRMDFWAPGAKPFITVRFWEVFWRPRTGKGHFLLKKSGIPPKIRNFTEIHEIPQFRGNSPEFTKRLCFALKSCPELAHLLILGQLAPETPEFEEFPQI